MLLQPICLSTRRPTGAPCGRRQVATVQSVGQQGRGCSASSRSILSSQESNEWKFTNRASGRSPTASRTRLSRTSIHSPMAVQPSSQTCRVIWVRDGRRLGSASEKEPGRTTSPSTDSRQSTEPLACRRRYSSLDSGRSGSPGLVVPVAGKDEGSCRRCSGARACPGSRVRWAMWVRLSANHVAAVRVERLRDLMWHKARPPHGGAVRFSRPFSQQTFPGCTWFALQSPKSLTNDARRSR